MFVSVRTRPIDSTVCESRLLLINSLIVSLVP